MTKPMPVPAAKLRSLLFGLLVLLAGPTSAEVARPTPRPLSGTVEPSLSVSPLPRSPLPHWSIGASGVQCGSQDVVGVRLDPVRDEDGCQIQRPVRILSISGIALEPPPVVDCALALRVRDWLVSSAAPAFAASGSPLAGLGIAAGYVCRTVNNAEEAALSQHAFGRAIDIARFRRADGSHVSVREDWESAGAGDLLRRVHAAGCAAFGTSLGPESDIHHQDHFHYDIAVRRSPFCPVNPALRTGRDSGE